MVRTAENDLSFGRLASTQMVNAPELSIVSPVYRTGSMLRQLVKRVVDSIPSTVPSYEIILVDDGSGDDSWNTIRSLSKDVAGLKGLKLTRNFGQHAAIAAGLLASRGEWVIVMDSDLQDRPEFIPELLSRSGLGCPIVLARRIDRKDRWSRRVGSRLFYNILSRLSDIPASHAIANFGIYHRRVIDIILRMEESHRFFPMMVAWTGYPVTYVDCVHDGRGEGASGYDLKKLISLAIQTTLSYSDKPLRYIVKGGIAISFLSVVYAVIVLIRYFTGKIVVLGYTSIIVSIWFIGGLLLFTMGVVGLYVGRTFEQVKKRPSFIIQEVTYENASH